MCGFCLSVGLLIAVTIGLLLGVVLGIILLAFVISCHKRYVYFIKRTIRYAYI